MVMKKRQNIRWVAALVMALTWLALTPFSAFAHRVTIFAWVDGDTIHTRSKIGGGKQIKDALVVVYNSRGDRLLEGRTDRDGMFSFKTPEKSDLKVVLTGSMGHAAEWKIPVDDIIGGKVEDNPSLSPKAAADVGPSKPAALPDRTPRPEPATGNLRPEDIEAIVNSALDKKLQPLTHMLEKAYQRGPGFTEIIGGIGYIFGLVGIALYVANRRRKADDA